MEESLIGQGAEKFQDVVSLRIGHRRMVNDGIFQGLGAAIVHIGSGDGDVAKGRGFESSCVLWFPGEIRSAMATEAGESCAEEEHFTMLRGG